MDYSDLIEEMERFNEADLWYVEENEDYDWEFYAIEDDGVTGELMEYIGHADDPVDAYQDAKDNGVEVEI